MMHPLHALFHPKSIAVIGASEVPGKAAERRTRSLIQGGYDGQIYLINPKRDRLFDRKAYPSVLYVGIAPLGRNASGMPNLLYIISQPFEYSVDMGRLVSLKYVVVPSSCVS